MPLSHVDEQGGARMVDVGAKPVTVRQALSNVTRKKSRLFLTWLTLTLAAGAFMGVLGSFQAMDALVDGIFNTFGYQLQVFATESQDFEQMKAPWAARATARA